MNIQYFHHSFPVLINCLPPTHYRWLHDGQSSDYKASSFTLYWTVGFYHSFVSCNLLRPHHDQFPDVSNCCCFYSSFKTLFGENVTKGGNKFTREYRGGGSGGSGGGPPKPGRG